MASSLLALIICQAESPNGRSAACYQPQTHRLTAAATLTPVPRIPNTPHLHSLTLAESSAVALWGVGNARKRKRKRGLQRESGRKSVCDCVTVLVCFLTVGNQFDLPADCGHLVPGQAAHGHRALQVAEDHLALQVVFLVKVRVHGDLGGVGGQRDPGG